MANKAGKIEFRKAERLLDRLVPAFLESPSPPNAREVAGALHGISKTPYQLSQEQHAVLLQQLRAAAGEDLSGFSESELSIVSLGSAVVFPQEGELWQALSNIAVSYMQQQLSENRGATTTSSSSSSGDQEERAESNNPAAAAGVEGQSGDVASPPSPTPPTTTSTSSSSSVQTAAAAAAGGPQQQQQQRPPWQAHYSPFPVVIAWAHARAGKRSPELMEALLQWLALPRVHGKLQADDVNHLWFTLAMWQVQLNRETATTTGSSSSSRGSRKQLTAASQSNQQQQRDTEPNGAGAAAGALGHVSELVNAADPYDKLAAATVAKIADFTPQRLRTVVWAVGSLQYHNPSLVSALGEQVQRFVDTGAATPALVASAWLSGATVEAEDVGLLLPAVELLATGPEQFSPAELLQLVHGSSRLKAGQVRLLRQALQRKSQPAGKEVRSQRGKRRLAQGLSQAAEDEQKQQQEAAAAAVVKVRPVWCQAVAQQVVQKALQFTPAEIAGVAKYWAMHEPELGLDEELFSAVAQQLQQRAGAFTSREAAMISSAFARLGFKEGLPALEAVQATLQGQGGGGAREEQGRQWQQVAALLRELQMGIERLQH